MGSFLFLWRFLFSKNTVLPFSHLESCLSVRPSAWTPSCTPATFSGLLYTRELRRNVAQGLWGRFSLRSVAPLWCCDVNASVSIATSDFSDSPRRFLNPFLSSLRVVISRTRLSSPWPGFPYFSMRARGKTPSGIFDVNASWIMFFLTFYRKIF